MYFHVLSNCNNVSLYALLCRPVVIYFALPFRLNLMPTKSLVSVRRSLKSKAENMTPGSWKRHSHYLPDNYCRSRKILKDPVQKDIEFKLCNCILCIYTDRT